MNLLFNFETNSSARTILLRKNGDNVCHNPQRHLVAMETLKFLSKIKNINQSDIFIAAPGTNCNGGIVVSELRVL